MLLPQDWGDPAAGPTLFDLPEQWKDLIERYRGLGTSSTLQAAFRVPAERATRALLERDYIDADFRSEFANFYAQTFRAVPDRCERVHFFDQERNEYLGFVVLRPIRNRPVCRTILAPPKGMEAVVTCQATATATPYGFRQQVRGFPFISQDYQYGVCSHAAIWMIGLYHHLAFGRPRRFISDIVAAARTHQDRWRLTPSEGLSFRQIIAILHELTMPPISYLLEGRPSAEVTAIARRYLNSRLPVLLLTEDHASVLIGHGVDESTGEAFFVRHDDASGPYQIETEVKLTEWRNLLVPLPGRIYISGEAAEEAGRFIFEKELAYRSELEHYQNAMETGKTRLVTYVTPIALYKRALRRRRLPSAVVNWHINVSTSNWVWVIELHDKRAADKREPCVIGEVAIDATSDKLWPNPLFANLPGVLLRWRPEGGQLQQGFKRSGVYESGVALSG